MNTVAGGFGFGCSQAGAVASGLLLIITCSLAVRGGDYFLARSQNDPQAASDLQSGVVYDGSSADRVDAFFQKVPENSSIHLGPHLFETRGVWDTWLAGQSLGFRLKSGWQIRGAGTNNVGGTVLRLIDVPVDQSRFFNCNAVLSTGGIGLYGEDRPKDRRPNINHVAIEDLQIDCNYQALAKAKGTRELQVMAIQILGNQDLRIGNVLVRNAASRRINHAGQQSEGFQVYLYNPWAGGVRGDYRIDRVAVTDYQGGYTSAICINGNATGIVERCTIDLASDQSQRYGINFAAGINRFSIAHNTVWNATRGINNDTGPVCPNVTISSNRFVQCSTGMLLANSVSNRVVGNFISLDGTGCGIAIQFHPTLDNVKSRACLVTGNVITAPGGEGISLCYQNEFDRHDLTLYWSSNNIVQNNVFAATLQNKIPPPSLALNIVGPGNRREMNEPRRGPTLLARGALSAVGFPSDIGPGAALSYCRPPSVDPSQGYIARVRLSGTKLDLRSDAGEGSGYSDFTTGYAVGIRTNKFQRNYEVQWADLQQGKNYRMGIYSSEHDKSANFRVYVDWDQNGTFDPRSELAVVGQRRGRLAAPLSVPSTALTGSTRMRVMLSYGPPPPPCASEPFAGEVEDYTVTILPQLR